MAQLDLHLHSTHSDGTRPPEWVVERAAAHGAELISLTDHDTLAGVSAARAAGRRAGVSVLAGVELGAHDDALNEQGVALGEVHVLGYFGDGAELSEMEAQLRSYREERESRAARTVARLAELGMPVELSTVERLADGGAVGRPHIARAMMEAGHAESVQEAFDRWLHNDGPAYVARRLLGLGESVAMIHEAGGLASLAHPSRYRECERASVAFAEAGGDGLEVYYRRDGPEVIAVGERLASRLGLIPTVGSDYHGLHADELEPGAVSMPEEASATLLARLKEL